MLPVKVLLTALVVFIAAVVIMRVFGPPLAAPGIADPHTQRATVATVARYRLDIYGAPHGGTLTLHRPQCPEPLRIDTEPGDTVVQIAKKFERASSAQHGEFWMGIWASPDLKAIEIENFGHAWLTTTDPGLIGCASLETSGKAESVAEPARRDR